MRGEYFTNRMPVFTRLELPPRARRILTQAIKQTGENGTTSACAENTSGAKDSQAKSWNYLRVRGEYKGLPGTNPRGWELPPRARRIPCTVNMMTNHTWNYLRVRGEYRGVAFQMKRFEELPPRARRILGDAISKGWENGTTSACAENTEH